MSIWQAFFLGIIQGITEFLPISSSGHLVLGQYFLGLEHVQNDVLFDLICHLGTLVAILYVLYPSIKTFFLTQSDRIWHILLATLPLIPLVLILKPLKTLFVDPYFLGPCFLVSSGLLFLGLYFRFPPPLSQTNRGLHSLAIGFFQALAILPGVSRSGATISAASMLGWERKEAITFSFLLAVPAILGGIFLEGFQIWKGSASFSYHLTDSWPFLVGFITSFFVGCASLRILVNTITQSTWRYFGWYCLLLGCFLTIYFNILPE